MKRLLYISDSTIGDNTGKLDDILGEAIIGNHNNGLTGLLWSTDKKFAQVIEGDEAKINQLLENLEKDLRHSNIDIVDYCDIEEREFGNWSMRFPDNDPLFEVFELLMCRKLRRINTDFANKFEEIINPYR